MVCCFDGGCGGNVDCCVGDGLGGEGCCRDGSSDCCKSALCVSI